MSLVLWFKSSRSAGSQPTNNAAPFYTVDARQRPLSAGARHLVADPFKGRARFVLDRTAPPNTPPYLDLSPLDENDQGEYRCRVDYRSKPRENFLAVLFVLGESSARVASRRVASSAASCCSGRRVAGLPSVGSIKSIGRSRSRRSRLAQPYLSATATETPTAPTAPA